MKEELVSLLSELQTLSQRADFVFAPEIEQESGLSPDSWDALQELIRQISLKSQEAFLLAAELKRQNKPEPPLS